MAEQVLFEKRDDIALLRFNRPGSYNSFDLDTITAFASHLVTLASDAATHGIVITGAGKAFCTGGDLRWAALFPGGPAAAFHELSSRFHQSILEIRNMGKPVIAAINGMAAGGGFSLALACDFRVMAKGAQLKQGFTSNGLSMDGGGTWMLPRLVGSARAMEIMAFDRIIDSGEALSMGLVNQVADDEGLIDAAVATARRVLGIPLFSFSWSKRLINASFNMPFESQLEAERRGLSSCAAHPGGKEGIAAFLEKRKPRFNP